ncbi:hypothetical protein NDU88_001670 [Pleurodeles waltl]|uniref:Secreted protein n=1 Tax=Pleurodeles waltl TaxID=8319 RepID=A0AAV7ML19_PLEWA|nr:hypothetical protein NDU88_001670 [Pleurodeles waltl]
MLDPRGTADLLRGTAVLGRLVLITFLPTSCSSAGGLVGRSGVADRALRTSSEERPCCECGTEVGWPPLPLRLLLECRLGRSSWPRKAIAA